MKIVWGNLLKLTGICAAIFALATTLRAADEFGDISVDPNAIYTGNTFHGYAEMRINLENLSTSKKHLVTLVYPNGASGSYGNNISRLSRTVTLGPGAREVVSLLQPPLSAQGGGSIRVEVDNRREGAVRAPNANSHCNFYSRGGQAATVFVSRSLDFDAVGRIFQPNSGAFTAAMAVGPPDATRTTTTAGGWDPNTWMPDTRMSGRTNWLDLDYATPQIARGISIHTMGIAPHGFIGLIGVSGTILMEIPMSSGISGSGTYRGRPGSNWSTEFSFPATSEPVKMLHLNFEKATPATIMIDAVEISGPTGSQWAASACASSDNSASASSHLPSRRNPDSVESLRAESPVSEWSGNWLAYSPFDAVVLNAADMSSMPPAVAGAIGDYLQAGGNVVICGRNSLPESWHPWRTQFLQGGFDYGIGFGRCFAFESGNASSLDPKSGKAVLAAVRDSGHYWQSLPEDGGSANSAMPIVENLKVPTRGIVIIMLAFVIIIGPVNIIYLNRRKHRTWMLWTIPAISFATTLMVFAYSMLSEGIRSDTRIAGLTLLDQATHHATTVGGTAFYCPLTPSAGLHFDYGTEVTPLVSLRNGSGTSREVDWTQSQQFQRGWISARVPAYFHLRKSETRRERIQVVSENGKLQVVNGLGAPIKTIWFADAKMNFYEAENVAAGQKAGLIMSPPLPASPPAFPPASEKYGADKLLGVIGFAAHTDSLNGNAEKCLLPNTYIAVLDGNPFIENALGSASSPKRTKSSAVVFGMIETSEAQ